MFARNDGHHSDKKLDAEVQLPTSEPCLYANVPGINEELRRACEMLAKHSPEGFLGASYSSEFADDFGREIANEPVRFIPSMNPEISHKLDGALNGRPLVDLCSGRFRGFDFGAALVASKYSASAYIGVDLHRKSQKDLSDANRSIGALTLCADAKSFLETIPERSVNFFTSGIDYNVWDPYDMPVDYDEQVAQLMISRCHSNGVILLDRVSKHRLNVLDLIDSNDQVHEFYGGGVAIFTSS